MITQQRRTKIGSLNGLATRQRVYRIAEGLEVDYIDHYEVTRKRVFFEDVLLVTYHRFRGAGFIVVMLLPSLFFGALMLAFFADDADAAGWLFGAITLMFLIPLILRIIFRVDAVTVYGKRSKAVLYFTFRKARARAVFNEICGAAASEQRRLATKIAAERVEPSSDVPLPPSIADGESP